MNIGLKNFKYYLLVIINSYICKTKQTKIDIMKTMALINLKSKIGTLEFYSACKRLIFQKEAAPHKIETVYGVMNFLNSQWFPTEKLF